MSASSRYCPRGSPVPLDVADGYSSTPDGAHDSAWTRTGASACSPGSFCVNGTRNVCGSGTYSPDYLMTSCSECPAGRYTPQFYHDHVLVCPLGLPSSQHFREPGVERGTFGVARFCVQRGNGRTVPEQCQRVSFADVVLPCRLFRAHPDADRLLRCDRCTGRNAVQRRSTVSGGAVLYRRCCSAVPGRHVWRQRRAFHASVLWRVRRGLLLPCGLHQFDAAIV